MRILGNDGCVFTGWITGQDLSGKKRRGHGEYAVNGPGCCLLRRDIREVVKIDSALGELGKGSSAVSVQLEIHLNLGGRGIVRKLPW